jgi:DNA-3-methyladenine glycosylase II
MFRLRETLTFSIQPPPPYSLALTAARFASFPEVVDLFDGAVYRRMVRAQGEPALMTVRQIGPVRKPELEVTILGRAPDGARRAVLDVLERSLGAAVEVRPFYRRLRSDPILAGCLGRFRGLRVAGWPDAWEALVTVVLSQQVNLQFAYSIRRELVRAFGESARIEDQVFYAFPPPEMILRQTPAQLREFRLSQGKAETLVRLADAFASGRLSDAQLRSLPDEAVVEQLTSIKGIGQWTADTVLLRGLGRVDAFPAGDLGVVKYLAQGLLQRARPASEAEMREFAECWRPYRGLALVHAYAELASRRRGNMDSTE